jgi:hypothetical protein
VGIVARKIRRGPAVVPPALPSAVLEILVRAFITAAILFSLVMLPGRAWAFGERSGFTFAVIRHSGNFNPRPTGLRRISWEVAKRTSVEVKLDSKVIDLTDPELFRYPVLVLTGDDDFTPFSDAEREALRRHLTFGGFLLIDAARRELKAILPTASVGRVPKTHVLYKSFYLLDRPFGRVDAASEADGIALQGRLAVLFSPNDLQGATARDGVGNFEYEVVPGGDTQRERAYRFGINIVMYALCLDYKDDQVHVEFLKKRRH